MSLSFAAFTPHSPLLIPSIGKEETNKVETTTKAMERLEQELYSVKPQLICIISPHVGLFEDAFTLNGHVSFISNFSEFGDVSPSSHWTGAPEIAARIVHRVRLRDIPIQLISEEALDHGCTVPLAFLTHHLGECKILPIGFSKRSQEDHVHFGTLLGEYLFETDKRVAVIASGDLSHTLSEESPGGFHPDGAVFEKKILSSLENGNTTDIIHIDKNVVQHADVCGYQSLLILLGILGNLPYHFETYAYEAPFGVGYLTGHFTW